MPSPPQPENNDENTPMLAASAAVPGRASGCSWHAYEAAASAAVNRWGMKILHGLAFATCMRTPTTNRFACRWWCSLVGPLLFTGVLLMPVTFSPELDASGCLNLATTVGMLLTSVWGLFFTAPSLGSIYDACAEGLIEGKRSVMDRSTARHLLGGGCVFAAFCVIYGLLFDGWVAQVSAHFPHWSSFISVAARADAVVLMCWTATFLMAVSRVCSMIGLEMESCASCVTTLKDRVIRVANAWDSLQVRPWSDAAAATASLAELGSQGDKKLDLQDGDLMVLNVTEIVEFVRQHAAKVQRIRVSIGAFSTSVGPFLTIALFLHGIDLVAYTWAFLISNFFAQVPEYQYWIGAGHDALCMMLTIWPVAWICKSARIIGSESDELATAVQRLSRPDLSAALAPQVQSARSFASNTFVALGGFAITPALLGSLTIFLCSSAASLLNYMHQHQPK